MPDSDRLEREIEEILGKIEQFPEAESRRKRSRRRALRQAGGAFSERQQAIARQLARISLSQVMLLSFLMILGSFFFRRMAPVLMEWVMYGGIILFISSFAILMIGGGNRRNQSANWRGRQIRYGGGAAYSSGPTMSDRLRRWWNSRDKRR